MLKKSIKLQHRDNADEILLAVLARTGCPLDHEHEIDHTFYCKFPMKEKLTERLIQEGLRIDEEAGSKTSIHCAENATPQSMRTRTTVLRLIAREFDAKYDGWGSACPTAKERVISNLSKLDKSFQQSKE